MNVLIVIGLIATLTICSIKAAPGLSGVVLSGPAGTVTDQGAIAPHDNGIGGYSDYNIGDDGGGHGVYAAISTPIASHGVPIQQQQQQQQQQHATAPLAEYGLHGGGVAAITRGGGTIGATGHGATISGPPTVPVIIKGPSGQIIADGLWGPTNNLGLGHGHGW